MDIIETLKELGATTSVQIRYCCDSAGRVRVWACWVTEKDGKPGIEYTDGLLEGKIKNPTFKASIEKNVGKANYLSATAQATEMLKQEVSKKEKENYFSTPRKAYALKEFRPMLCPSGMKWKDYTAGGSKAKKVSFPALASPKLDGARANMGATTNTFYLFEEQDVMEVYPIRTREGRDWHNFAHLKEDKAFQAFFADYPTVLLDGEMYNHKYKEDFEALMSVFRKEKPTSDQRALSARVSRYYVYDIYDKARPELTAFERQQFLLEVYEKYFKGQTENFYPLFSKVVHSYEEFDSFHEKCMDEGYEGTILRIIDEPYGVESRSGELLKRKDEFDCEFTITDVFEGEGSKAGVAAGVWISLTSSSGMNSDDQVKLDTTKEPTQKAGLALGWDDVKAKELLENKEHYIGKMGTITYFGITAYGKLRFPKFKALRHD